MTSFPHLVQLLHDGAHSLVIDCGTIRTFDRRGVADLYELLQSEPRVLQDAAVADKVVGKAAAALMILGGVRSLWADVISRPALELLSHSAVNVTYGRVVPHIINRTRTGRCPLELRCRHCTTPQACFTEIKAFMALQSPTQNTKL